MGGPLGALAPLGAPAPYHYIPYIPKGASLGLTKAKLLSPHNVWDVYPKYQVYGGPTTSKLSNLKQTF